MDEHIIPIKRAASSLASSSAKRIKPPLPDAVVKFMKRLKGMFNFQELIMMDNEETLREESDLIIWNLVAGLSNTNMKGSLISCPNLNSAASLFESFTVSEWDLWRDGIRNGVDNDDWSDFIMHRKYISDS